jgi:hypothetical protein
MNANELKWARRANLENMFTLQWTTWEKLEDGRIQGQVCVVKKF